MTVESNYAIAIATLSDLVKNLTPVYQHPARRKSKPIATCRRDFSLSLSELHGIATNFDRFDTLFAPAIIGRSNYFGICFTTFN